MECATLKAEDHFRLERSQDQLRQLLIAQALARAAVDGDEGVLLADAL